MLARCCRHYHSTYSGSGHSTPAGLLVAVVVVAIAIALFLRSRRNSRN
jgi:hypothetical protein